MGAKSDAITQKVHAQGRQESEEEITFRVMQGDNMALLPTLADNSVDAIVTDPRLNVILPNDSEVVALIFSKCSFFYVIRCVMNLYGRKNFASVKAGIGVPECAMNFDNGIGFGQKEIVCESAESKLPLKKNTLFSVTGGYFRLKFIKRFASFTIYDLLRSKFAVTTSGFGIGKLSNVSVS